MNKNKTSSRMISYMHLPQKEVSVLASHCPPLCVFKGSELLGFLRSLVDATTQGRGKGPETHGLRLLGAGEGVG